MAYHLCQGNPLSRFSVYAHSPLAFDKAGTLIPKAIFPFAKRRARHQLNNLSAIDMVPELSKGLAAATRLDQTFFVLYLHGRHWSEYRDQVKIS